MTHPRSSSIRILFTLAVAASAVAHNGCNCELWDDEPPPGGTGDDDGGTGGDGLSCVQSYEALLAEGCPPGFTPKMFQDGGNSQVVLVDDPVAGTALNLGVFFNWGAGTSADWIATSFTQNADCTVGCFLGCQVNAGQEGCIGNVAMGYDCQLCANDLDQQTCVDFLDVCMGGGDEGSVDETGGADTTGGAGVFGDDWGEYDCNTWNPQDAYYDDQRGVYVIPQSLFDEIAFSGGNVLACDGTTFHSSPSGHVAIKTMDANGLLDRLGLARNDVFLALDGVEMDSFDALSLALMDNLVDANGWPLQFDPNHRGFLLRMQRRDRRFVVPVRIEPD